jgi:toxin-antitoxin system PIN domain toxin
LIRIPDVNVLIAAAWPNHVHHAVSRSWFEHLDDAVWATCPITESGFVRISSNARVMPEARTPREALALLRRLLAVGRHRFLDDAVALSAMAHIDERRLVGYRQVPDAHLLSVARSHGALLVTLDRGITDLLDPADAAASIEVLERVS